jgi:hypothetical protein
MLKIAITVLATIFLLPAQAKSQDALGTFIFLFVDSTIDTSRDYGSEFSRDGLSKEGMFLGRQTVKSVAKCAFESKIEGNAGGEGAPKNLRVVEITRWDFNKAFFDETKVQLSAIGEQEFVIHGDSGLFYRGLLCLSDARTCEWGSGYRGERQSNQFVQSLSEQSERSIKAMKYFVQTFCPGTKRKSAF